MPCLRRGMERKEISQMTNTQKRIDELESEVRQTWKLLWILAKRKGGALTFTPKELQTMRQGGKISRTVDANGVVTVEAQ
jgi:hypothetical protein